MSGSKSLGPLMMMMVGVVVVMMAAEGMKAPVHLPLPGSEEVAGFLVCFSYLLANIDFPLLYSLTFPNMKSSLKDSRNASPVLFP